MRFAQFALVAAVWLCPLSARANDLPQYDVAAHCERIANAGGSYSATIDNLCVEQEQAAYDALKANIGGYPQKTLAHCGKIAAAMGTGSYNLMKLCIEQELQAMGTKKKFTP